VALSASPSSAVSLYARTTDALVHVSGPAFRMRAGLSTSMRFLGEARKLLSSRTFASPKIHGTRVFSLATGLLLAQPLAVPGRLREIFCETTTRSPRGLYRLELPRRSHRHVGPQQFDARALGFFGAGAPVLDAGGAPFRVRPRRAAAEIGYGALAVHPARRCPSRALNRNATASLGSGCACATFAWRETRRASAKPCADEGSRVPWQRNSSGKYGVPCPRGFVARSPDEAKRARKISARRVNRPSRRRSTLEAAARRRGQARQSPVEAKTRL